MRSLCVRSSNARLGTVYLEGDRLRGEPEDIEDLFLRPRLFKPGISDRQLFDELNGCTSGYVWATPGGRAWDGRVDPVTPGYPEEGIQVVAEAGDGRTVRGRLSYEWVPAPEPGTEGQWDVRVDGEPVDGASVRPGGGLLRFVALQRLQGRALWLQGDRGAVGLGR